MRVRSHSIWTGRPANPRTAMAEHVGDVAFWHGVRVELARPCDEQSDGPSAAGVGNWDESRGHTTSSFPRSVRVILQRSPPSLMMCKRSRARSSRPESSLRAISSAPLVFSYDKDSPPAPPPVPPPPPPLPPHPPVAMQPGRDHWPLPVSCFKISAAAASPRACDCLDDRHGADVSSRRVGVRDFPGHYVPHLGIEPTRLTAHDNTGRPIPVVADVDRSPER